MVALSSRERWYAANYFAGWVLLMASGVSGVLVILAEDNQALELAGLAGPLAFAVVACFASRMLLTQ